MLFRKRLEAALKQFQQRDDLQHFELQLKALNGCEWLVELYAPSGEPVARWTAQEFVELAEQCPADGVLFHFDC